VEINVSLNSDDILIEGENHMAKLDRSRWGWHNEPARHALAAKGIETKRAPSLIDTANTNAATYTASRVRKISADPGSWELSLARRLGGKTPDADLLEQKLKKLAGFEGPEFDSVPEGVDVQLLDNRLEVFRAEAQAGALAASGKQLRKDSDVMLKDRSR